MSGTSIPSGICLAQGKVLTFGDDVARLDVVPILPGDETVQTVSKGDPKLPPYYFSLVHRGSRRIVVQIIDGTTSRCWCSRKMPRRRIF